MVNANASVLSDDMLQPVRGFISSNPMPGQIGNSSNDGIGTPSTGMIVGPR